MLGICTVMQCTCPPTSCALVLWLWISEAKRMDCRECSQRILHGFPSSTEVMLDLTSHLPILCALGCEECRGINYLGGGVAMLGTFYAIW